MVAFTIILLGTIWIMFDGFNSYRDYLWKKECHGFHNIGEVIIGTGRGPFLSKSELTLAIDDEGYILDSRIIYFCKFVCIPKIQNIFILNGKNIDHAETELACLGDLEIRALKSASQNYSEKKLIRYLDDAISQFNLNENYRWNLKRNYVQDSNIMILIENSASKE